LVALRVVQSEMECPEVRVNTSEQVDRIAFLLSDVASLRLHLEKERDDRDKFRTACMLSRLLERYNDQLRQIQDALESLARATERVDDASFDVASVWNRVHRFRGSAECVPLLGAQIDILCDVQRARDVDASLCNDATASLWIERIADVMYASRVDSASPTADNQTARASHLWRSILFQRQHPHLLIHQQSVDDTLRVLFEMLGVRGLLRRQSWTVSVPHDFPYKEARGDELRNMARANAELRIPSIPYARVETHDAVMEHVEGGARSLVTDVYPQVSETDVGRRKVVHVAVLESAPSILILSRARAGSVAYGDYDAASGRCTLRMNVQAMRDSIRDLSMLVHTSSFDRASTDACSTVYELRSVICWHGAADGSSGHYNTWTFEDGDWFFYNGSQTRTSFGCTPEHSGLASLAVWSPSRAGTVFMYAKTS